MKIAIDLRPLQSPTKSRGIGYFTYYLTEALIKVSPKKISYLFYKSPIHPLGFKVTERAGDKYYKIPTLFWPKRGLRRFDLVMSRLWKEALKKSKPDLLHLTSFFEVYYLDIPKNIKTIVTLHDVIPVVFKDQYFANQKAVDWYFGRIDQIRSADKIITISKSAKQDLTNLLKIPKEKIEVVYGAVSKNYLPIDRKKARSYLAIKYKINDQFLLSIGAFSFHKNLDNIFKAFKKYLESSNETKLVVVCKLILSEERLLKEKLTNLGILENVILTNFVPDKDMPYFYSGADALVFPSLYEGFGLPILEAQACGCPVITSNISSMPEIAGKGAVLVDPYSVEEITKAMMRLMITGERLTIVKAGKENAKKYTWEVSAKKTLKIYQAVLSS